MDEDVPQDLCVYRRSAPAPEKMTIEITMKRHQVALKLDISAMGVMLKEQDLYGQSPARPLSKVLEEHAMFKAALQPDLAEPRTKHDVDEPGDLEAEQQHQAKQPDLRPGSIFRKLCTSDINTISLFFPDLSAGPVHNIFSAWLAYICAVDDILEAIDPTEARDALTVSMAMVKGEDTGMLLPSNPRIPDMTKVLCTHIGRMDGVQAETAQAFFTEVAKVLQAHYDELDFLEDRSNDLDRYLDIRRRTISLSPFFAVLRECFLPDNAKGCELDLWIRLQNAVSMACGLQNDLIGLEKDLEKGDQMNAVVVHLRSRSGNVLNLNETLFRESVNEIVRKHNKSVDLALMTYETLTNSEHGQLTVDIARQVIFLIETHMRWCASAKRYRVKAKQRHEVLPSGWEKTKDLLPALGFEGELPTPAASSSLGSPDVRAAKKRKRNDSEVSVTTNSTYVPPRSLQVIRSDGVFHGLPTYADNHDTRNLTAVVTGATGVSGYHMVKVLAASPRWSKIYCLSSRPPPENFFADLGAGGARVEHLAVDFLADPSDIAVKLQEKIEHIDHIFYFSYTHPVHLDNVLNFWADADGLNKVNLALFTNFLAALKQTALIPKRFILQTGTKHYGFYLGPANLPASESDPRVTLDQNFYYAQEDALAKFCEDSTLETKKMTWAVARPNYIVGAVRDGTLNHLLGIGIYAAVQARLGLLLKFPGDYRAWDREQVQSTGLLSAYFEEWLALSDLPDGQAFNIHDGQNFSWGRLWPLIAKWFGMDWAPPEVDEREYRTFTMPGETPRGYGPQVTMNSTFSLLEWSQQSEVEKAWKDLAAEHDLVLDPFTDQYRARIFSFADSAIIGDGAMTTSIRKAREHGFFGTVDSFRTTFDTFHEMARLKLSVAPTVTVFEEW